MTDVSQAEGELDLVEAETAAEVCQDLDLEEQAEALLDDKQSPREFLDRLTEAGQLADAAGFLAHALPKREAVWWACLCARGSGDGEPADEEEKRLKIAEAWVEQPDEDRRTAALAAAEASEYETPAAWAAAAAAWSSGSLAPPDLEEVPPGETLTAKAVTATVMLAAAAGEPQGLEARQRKFLELAREIASGGRRWSEPGRKEKPSGARRQRKGSA